MLHIIPKGIYKAVQAEGKSQHLVSKGSGDSQYIFEDHDRLFDRVLGADDSYMGLDSKLSIFRFTHASTGVNTELNTPLSLSMSAQKPPVNDPEVRGEGR